MRFFIVLGYSILCAILLNLFAFIEDMTKFIFSLGVLFAGIQFFKRYESRGMRIWFVVTTVILYFVFTIIYGMYVYIKTGEVLPPPV